MGSAQRAMTASLLKNLSTAAERPLTSERGCVPCPPPCSPFVGGFGAKQDEGKANLRVSCSETLSRTPQRTHRSRLRSTQTDAAEEGSKVLEASIQAQTLPIAVICDRNESAKDIRPEHVSPTSSVRAPTGSPPSSSSSRGPTPEETTGRTMRGGGVSAEGYFRARADSTCTRIVAAEAIVNTFALSSPVPPVYCQMAPHSFRCSLYVSHCK